MHSPLNAHWLMVPGLLTVGLLGFVSSASGGEIVFLTGQATQMLGFAAEAGTMVICEGQVVNGKCDSAGVSDINTWSGMEGVPDRWYSDSCTFLECAVGPSDHDVSFDLVDITTPGVKHASEASLALSSYNAVSPSDPGYDLTNNSAVSYFFDRSALFDTVPEPAPEPANAVPAGAALAALFVLRRICRTSVRPI